MKIINQKPNYQNFDIKKDYAKNNYKNFYAIKNNICLDTVSFTSNNLLQKNSKEITEIIQNAINLKNKIGFGSEGTVYKIPDTDYCIKILSDSHLKNFGDWVKNISKKDKINHIEAKAKNGSIIMRYIEGIPLKWFKNSEIFDLSNDTFINLFKQITLAVQNGMHFDTAPSNIIYNSKNKTLTVIDFREENTICPTQVLSSAFTSLKDNNKAPDSLINNRKLMKSFITVIINELTKNKNPDFIITESDIRRLFTKYKMTQNMNYPPQLEFLEKSVINLLKLTQEPFKKENKDRINGEIKFAKCIVNQILT